MHRLILSRFSTALIALATANHASDYWSIRAYGHAVRFSSQLAPGTGANSITCPVVTKPPGLTSGLRRSTLARFPDGYKRCKPVWRCARVECSLPPQCNAVPTHPAGGVKCSRVALCPNGYEHSRPPPGEWLLFLGFMKVGRSDEGES